MLALRLALDGGVAVERVFADVKIEGGELDDHEIHQGLCHLAEFEFVIAPAHQLI